MAEPHIPDRVLLVIATFSRHMTALDWACGRLREEFGPIALRSRVFEFNQTSYYEATMGRDLRKQFLVFGELVAPDCLPATKLRTNALESEIAEGKAYPESRPLNLDPGILTLGKFQLATMKDQAHRIYLGGGVYSEVTLRFQAGSYEPWPWTYADYRQPVVLSFMLEAREFYRQQLRNG
jgi:hypothetical protein